MKITFVTRSHTLDEDETETVDVARMADLKDANGHIGELRKELADLSRQMASLNKSVAQLEKSLADVDLRLRDDCRNIFSNLIEESLAPVFAVVKQVASPKEVKPAKKTVKTMLKKTPGKKTTSPAAKKTGARKKAAK